MQIEAPGIYDLDDEEKARPGIAAQDRASRIEPLVLVGASLEIALRGSDKTALVDEAFGELARRRWHLGSDGYARRKATKEEMALGAPANISMQREVAGLHLQKGAPGLPEVDHINGNRLDNRTENLRVCSRSDNNLNRHAGVGRSMYVGVSYFKPAKLWRAYITINGKRTEIGYFRTEEAAASARRDYEDLHLPERVSNCQAVGPVND